MSQLSQQSSAFKVSPYPLVIDNGAYDVKIGTTNQQTPRVHKNFVFHQEAKNDKISPIRHASQIPHLKSVSNLQFHFAQENAALDNSSDEPHSPYPHTKLNAHLQCKIWHHILEQEHIMPQSFHLITTKSHDCLVNGNEVRMAEMIFEAMEFPLWSAISSGYASLLGFATLHHDALLTSTASACIVDLGHRSTRVIPVIRHQVQYEAIHELNLGGTALTAQLQRILTRRHFDFSHEWWITNYLKEKMLYCSMDYFREVRNAQVKASQRHIAQRFILPPGEDEVDESMLGAGARYHDAHYGNVGFIAATLPEENTRNQRRRRSMSSEDSNPAQGAVAEVPQIILTDERISIPEQLFTPNTNVLQCWSNFSGDAAPTARQDLSLTTAIIESICNHNFSLEDQKVLLQNIVLVGGSSQFYNLHKRLGNEISKRIFPLRDYARVRFPANKPALAWHGAAHFAQHGVLDELRITKELYYEMGPSIVKRRMCSEMF